MAAHLPGLLQAAGASSNAAVATAALVGPAQVCARLVEFGLFRSFHPIFSARIASVLHPIGAAFIALPVFLMRRFHHGGFVVRPDSGIKEPKDLEGKKVGVRAYSVTTGVWTRGIFVNAVDDTASAAAYLGGVVRKAGVTVAVSTDGRAPALAGLLREALEAVLPDDLDQWVEAAFRLRSRWRADNVPMAERRPQLLRALEEIYR